MARVSVDRFAIRRAARQAGREELTIGLSQALNISKVMTPVDTGRLRANTRVVIETRALGVTGSLVNTVDYARFVHDGTQPHVIRPKNRRGRNGRDPALRFRVGGQVVYARVVNHPGTRARPFLARPMQIVAARRGWRLSGRGIALS